MAILPQIPNIFGMLKSGISFFEMTKYQKLKMPKNAL